MEILIILLLVVIAIVIYGVYSSSKNKKLRQEIVERRQRFVETIAPNSRILVNNGIHLFFMNDDKQIFGLDESGKTYSYDGLHCVSTYRDCINFYHKDSCSLCVGKNRSSSVETIPLDSPTVNKIAAEMIPILRKNLHDELAIHALTPTYEYEHEGIIWGCDMANKMFYTTFGSIQIFPFSDLIRITVEDMRNNSLFDGSYTINLYVKSGFGWDDEFSLTFHEMDAKFNNLLAMFKAIRKYR